MRTKRVRDVMRRGTVACRGDETLKSVAQRLCKGAVTATFVVDENGWFL